MTETLVLRKRGLKFDQNLHSNHYLNIIRFYSFLACLIFELVSNNAQTLKQNKQKANFLHSKQNLLRNTKYSQKAPIVKTQKKNHIKKSIAHTKFKLGILYLLHIITLSTKFENYSTSYLIVMNF